MKALWRILNASFLFLTTAMYLGTGWSMWLFQFPVAPRLTPDNYYWVFVPQVASATAFFTWMTSFMIASALVMLWLEWSGGIRWVPVIVLLGVIVATWVTVQFIFPYNNEMSAGIKDPAKLQSTLASWIQLNRVRVVLWTVQWAAMMYYFARHAWESLAAARA